ncbi:MAG: AraC family transcriptional regulator ligand-binding domain-containing protein [Lamprobacter sp.]|uniref:AraC family transcriptional regulator n=1 Tax=Lamprobacter sp. TaxID=3100796 RepID=UPI002B261CD7|nr:AraC family transcriptional regulator ligand-binding domain-containing protein [Lamprobacter sp.]MEA3642045.1 AraC family transcriptional regulator ligand-binding domain-containing protein [Lamprobacter sp.]
MAALGLPAEGMVRMAVVRDLPGLMAREGLDPDVVIRALGCHPELFDDVDNTIAFRSVGRLLEHVAATTACAYPGLALGRQSGLDVAGPVGRATRLAPTLGAGLRLLMLYLHLHDRGAVPYLCVDGQQARFGYTLWCTDVVGTDHIYDGALAIASNMIAELCGPDWRASEVRFFRQEPTDIAAFQQHFKAPLRFAAQQAAILFPASDLKRPCASADAVQYAKAKSDLESLGSLYGPGFLDKVRRVILRLLVSGPCRGRSGPDRAEVAELFALHPRTLNRRLREEGVTFAELLAGARYDLARQLLRDTQLSVGDIAYALGYAGSGPFSHAFRHWSGVTAASWRKTHGDHPATASGGLTGLR